MFDRGNWRAIYETGEVSADFNRLKSPRESADDEPWPIRRVGFGDDHPNEKPDGGDGGDLEHTVLPRPLTPCPTSNRGDQRAEE